MNRQDRNLRKGLTRQLGREPTADEMAAIKKGRALAMLTGREVAVGVPETKLAPNPTPARGALMPKETVDLGAINCVATPSGLEFDSIDDRDAVASEASYVWHTAQFQAARSHADQLRHAQGALIATLLEKAGRSGVADVLMRDAAIMAIIVGIEDQLSGRDSLLLRKVALPVRPEVEGNKTMPTPQWIASAFIVALGKAVERFAGLTKEPALCKVIADLEAAAQLGEQLDAYFPKGNATGINKGKEGRIEDLALRFGKKHFAKLTKRQAPHLACWVYDLLVKDFAANTPETLAKAYPLWLNIARQYIQQAKVRPDTLGGQKAGSRRDQAREKLQFSTAD